MEPPEVLTGVCHTKKGLLIRPRNPMICAFMAQVIGLQFLFGPDKWFKSTTYKIPFMLGRPFWGFAFFFAGLAAALFHWSHHAIRVYSVLLAVILAWTLCSVLSVIHGSSAGYTGPVLWIALSSMLANSIVRFGSGRTTL